MMMNDPLMRLRLTPTVVKFFIFLMNVWDVPLSQRWALLGGRCVPFNLKYYNPKVAHMLPALTGEQLQRFFLLIEIAQALRGLLGQEQADNWVKRPNQHPLFGGACALDYMIENNLAGIKRVHSYLSSQSQGGYL